MHASLVVNAFGPLPQDTIHDQLKMLASGGKLLTPYGSGIPEIGEGYKVESIPSRSKHHPNALVIQKM